MLSKLTYLNRPSSLNVLRLGVKRTARSLASWSARVEEETARILDGKLAATEWLRDLQPEVHKITSLLQRPPRLAAILVGDRPDSALYVQRKADTCHNLGIEVVTQRLPASISQSELEDRVNQTCRDKTNDAVLVQMPLPHHLDEDKVVEFLDPWKDVDALHPHNMGRVLLKKTEPRFVPCTALGCVQLLKRNHIDISNKIAVVVGDSNYVGIPLSVLLRKENAAIVSVCHGISYKELFEDSDLVQQQRAELNLCSPAIPHPIDKTNIQSIKMNPSKCPITCNPHLPSITRTADILVVAVGWPELIKEDWVKPGAVVLDVGINVKQNKNRRGKPQIAGDVDFEHVSRVASAITPVPGGIGPMTIAGVVHNTLQAAKHTLLLNETVIKRT